jgi:hypothetical protein
MLIIFVSELTAVLGFSKFTSSSEALREIFIRNKESVRRKFQKKYLDNNGRRRSYGQKEQVLTKDKELVEGLLIRGRITVTERGVPVLMKRRKQCFSTRVFDEDLVSCEFYSWLFNVGTCILEINITDGSQGYVEKQIPVNEKHFNQHKDMLIDILNKNILTQKDDNDNDHDDASDDNDDDDDDDSAHDNEDDDDDAHENEDDLDSDEDDLASDEDEAKTDDDDNNKTFDEADQEKKHNDKEVYAANKEEYEDEEDEEYEDEEDDKENVSEMNKEKDEIESNIKVVLIGTTK